MRYPWLFGILIVAHAASLEAHELRSMGSPLPGHILGDPADLPNISVDGVTNSVNSTRAAIHAVDRLEPEILLLARGAKEIQIYSDWSPSVVLVGTDEGFGSGVVITTEGTILTSWHVISESSVPYLVFKPDVEGAKPSLDDITLGVILKVDVVADLALIRPLLMPREVKPIPLGESDEVIVGADVHAIGHPTREGWTYTRGIISQVRREYRWITPEGSEHMADVIQTQTPINPGNSGGPLLTDSGHLIGINAFVAEGEGLNYAIAIAEIRRFLERKEDRLVDETKELVNETRDEVSCQTALLESGRTEEDNGSYGLYDEDCDGESDYEVFVPDDQDDFLYILMDTNGDGLVDYVAIDIERDEIWDMSFIDVNFDGETDVVGCLLDGEFEPKKLLPYDSANPIPDCWD